MPPTLAELKAENAQEEAMDKLGTEQEGDAQIKPEITPEPEPELEAEPEPESEAEEGEENTDWMKPEGDEPEAKFTDSDAAAIRRKWKGKVSEKDTEIEALKQKVAELEKVRTPAQAAALPEKPKRDAFDSEEEWIEALTDYRISLLHQQGQSKAAAESQQQKQQAHQAKVQSAVDQHYTRAVKLSEKSGIKDEAYKAADQKVRQAIEAEFPKAGDVVTDALIASLGEGSERVFYHLGVNTAKRAKLIELFQDDRTGIKAAAYLGRLNMELSAPPKRESSAPNPMDKVQGDKAGGNATAEKLRKQYQAAHARGDGQAAFTIKRQAKDAKVDVSKW